MTSTSLRQCGYTGGQPRPSIIYVLGAPGAGKGTMCKLLAKHFTNVHHLSAGDHLRALVDQDPSQDTTQSFGSLSREQFVNSMQRRELLKADDIVSILDDAINAIVDKYTTNTQRVQIILLDGFPRSPESADLATDIWGLPSRVLFFDCPRQEAERRFLERRRSVDDGVEVFRFRCDEFEKLNEGIMARYGDLVVQIDSGMGPGETWEALKEKILEFLEELGRIKMT